jgi:hypothetical protein
LSRPRLPASRASLGKSRKLDAVIEPTERPKEIWTSRPPWPYLKAHGTPDQATGPHHFKSPGTPVD